MTIGPFLALLAVTAAWFLLPLVPALREFFAPTDATPLNAVGTDAGDLTVFADGFRDYLARQLPSPLSAAAHEGTLKDGTPYVQVVDDPLPLRSVTDEGGVVPRIVIATGPLVLPGGETFLLETLARDRFIGGPGGAYRAIRGERDIWLGPDSAVLRWAHAQGDLRLGRGTVVYGRASAGGLLVLDRGVRVQRVRAQRLVAGALEDLTPPADPPSSFPLLSGTMRLPAGARRERGFVRVHGDLTIPDGESIAGALVVTGNLTVGSGARVSGAVKVHGSCVLGDAVTIDGSVVCREAIRTGARCAIRGSLVAERDVTVGGGSWVGAPTVPASVSASTIVLHPGAQVFGAVTAREWARLS